MIHEQLRALRQRTSLSIRAVAERLGFEAHSKYAYYESPRFKGPLPMGLTEQLIKLWGPFGVEPKELYLLAGMNADGAAERESERQFDDFIEQQSTQVKMQVVLPPRDFMAALFRTLEKAISKLKPWEDHDRFDMMAAMFPDAFQELIDDLDVRDMLEPGYSDRLLSRILEKFPREAFIEEKHQAVRRRASNDAKALGGTG